MEVLGWIEDVAREMRVWCVKMVENAVGDDEGIKEMSQQLGCRPCICARVAKKGAPQPARAEGNPEELGVTSPFSCLPLMPFPSPVTFADLSGCLVKRSKQLEEDQPHSAKNLSLVCDTEPLFLGGLGSHLG